MTSAATSGVPRIVLFGVGRYGLRFTRLARLKGWQVVAALNRAGPKVGQDLGTLAGCEEPSGVIVQDCDTVDLSTVEADVGVVFVSDSLQQNWTAYELLLKAGLNVICHGVQAYHPRRYDPDTSARLDALAREKGRTFTGTGIWDMSRIWAGMLAAGPCVTLNGLRHRSITELNYPDPKIVPMLGLDTTPENFIARFTRKPGGVQDYGLAGKYQAIPEMVLEGLGFTVTSGRETHEPMTSEQPVHCKALERSIEPGRVIGWRYRSVVETREGVTAESTSEMRLLEEGEQEQMIWEVDGLPRNRIVVQRWDSVEASAAAVLNRIPDVIAAPPGIQLLSQLGPMRPHLQL